MNIDDPLISIITINKNNSNGLNKTIESVKNQKFLNKEFVIIDGSSEDNSMMVINKHKNYLSNYLIEEDNGIADAFNKGIKLSKGKWIIFLNSGDTFANTSVLNKINIILENCKKDFVVGKVNLIRDNKFCGQFGGKDLNINKLKYFNNIPHQSTFTQRNFFKTYGFFDEKFKIAMDYEILLRNLKNLDIELINEIIAEVEFDGITRKDEFKTYKYYKNAQIKNKVQNRFLINITYLYMITKVTIKKILKFK